MLVKYDLATLSDAELQILKGMMPDIQQRSAKLGEWFSETLRREYERRETNDPSMLLTINLSAWTPSDYGDAIYCLFLMLAALEGELRLFVLSLIIPLMLRVQVLLRSLEERFAPSGGANNGNNWN
jgi:hypothetical protein